MVKANWKRILLSATIALGAAMVTPGPAMALYQQDPEALYHYSYYNEDYSQEVGHESDTCNYFGVGRTQLTGVRTNQVWQTWYAYCRDGQLSLT